VSFFPRYDVIGGLVGGETAVAGAINAAAPRKKASGEAFMRA
jgi:hypothetical protein